MDEMSVLTEERMMSDLTEERTDVDKMMSVLTEERI